MLLVVEAPCAPRSAQSRMRLLSLAALFLLFIATAAMDVVVDILTAAPGNAKVTTKNACA